MTIAGKQPTHVNANQTIQSAIDLASPGDLIIVDPTCTTAGTTTLATCSSTSLDAATPTQTASTAAHVEMLLMWKPVRLQGVGAASSIIDANAFPAGKLLDPWRRHINCLFGLTLQGVPVGTTAATGGTPAAYDSSNTYSCPDTSGGSADTWNYFVGQTNAPQIDRLPLEAVVGWDATVNGNLAEQLQEPSLMGAYEGAGITVLGKGVWVPAGESPWTDGSEPGAFPPDALLLQDVPAGPDDEGAALGPQYSYCFTPGTTTELVPNPYPSNFMCNPSSIDGLTIRDASQGGGGIFAHGWNHNLQIANDRIYNNAGTLSGGVTIGQGEFPIAITIVDQEGTSGPTAPLGEFVADNPPSCQENLVLGLHLPYCLDLHVNVHNNYITSNSSLGDELFSGTLSGGGGATFCTGSDYYKFNYNWVCGNLSTAEGGGVVHLGFIYDGDIEHNTIALNQSTNPTIPTNGGGIQVMGTPDTDPVCGTQIDADCPPGLSDGTGPNLVINANLIQANTAESGSGGGIRLQQVNGTEVSTFPKENTAWNSVSITNNIITNNVAGWDGAGISLQDSIKVSIVNNTIARNDSLASSGVLTQSIGTPEASAPAGNCVKAGPTGPSTASCPQSSGITSTQNSTIFTTSLTGLTLTCPFGKTGCAAFSNPVILNDLIYQNRAFQIGITGPGTGNQNQQNLVALFNDAGAALASQASTGACNTNDTYWDIGVRGDTGPTNHASGYTLTTQQTLTSTGANPRFISSYCNGSRVPPECSAADGCGGPSGYGVPPGIVDASTPNPVFTLTPAATVDEGNNWINVSWGPLALSNDALLGASGNYGSGLPLGNYGLDPNSPAIDKIPVSEALPTGITVPTTDFYGNPRPNPDLDGLMDYGAVETQTNVVAVTPTLTSIVPNSALRGTSVNVVLTGTHLTGTTAITVSGAGVTVSGIGVVSDTTVDATFTITATAAVTARTVSAVTSAGTTNTVTFTVLSNAPTLASIAPTSGVRGTVVPVTLTGTFLNGATWRAGIGTTYPNITFGPLTVNATGTSATASLTLAAATSLGVKNLSVTTANGTSNTVAFTVTGATLTFSAPTPALTTRTLPRITVPSRLATRQRGQRWRVHLHAAPTVTKTAGGTTTGALHNHWRNLRFGSRRKPRL